MVPEPTRQARPADQRLLVKPRPPGAASSPFSPAGRLGQPARVRPTGPTRKPFPVLRTAPSAPPASARAPRVLRLLRPPCRPPEKQPPAPSGFDRDELAEPPCLNHTELSSVVRRWPRRAQKAGTAPDQVRVGVGTDSTRTAYNPSDPTPLGRPTPPTASEPSPPSSATPPNQQP